MPLGTPGELYGILGHALDNIELLKIYCEAAATSACSCPKPAFRVWGSPERHLEAWHSCLAQEIVSLPSAHDLADFYERPRP